MFQFRRNRKLPVIGLFLMIFAHSAALAQVTWVKNYDDALKQAAREKKFIILDISASW